MLIIMLSATSFVITDGAKLEAKVSLSMLAELSLLCLHKRSTGSASTNMMMMIVGISVVNSIVGSDSVVATGLLHLRGDVRRSFGCSCKTVY